MGSSFNLFYIRWPLWIVLISNLHPARTFQTPQTATIEKNLFSVLSAYTCVVSRTQTEKQVTKDKTSPCIVKKDVKYSGAFVDCSDMGISSIDSTWFPSNTTILLLDNNNIGRLRNGTFQKLKSLRVLSIKNSTVRIIEVNALKGLHRLKSLNLEKNFLELREYAFPRGMFQFTPDLKELYIGYNTKPRSGVHIGFDTSTLNNYSQFIDMFFYLGKLQSLSIDAFNVMNVGEEFSNLNKLSTLAMFCGNTSVVTNESFVGLGNIQLKHLRLDHFYNTVEEFSTGAFQYLKHLDSLTIESCTIGNHNLLATLWPFVNRTMSFLVFAASNIPLYAYSPSVAFEDGIITKKAAVFLNNICVTNFTWTASLLFAFEQDALSRGLFARCLKVLDLSKTNIGLVDWRVSAFQFTLFKSVETLIFSYLPLETHRLQVKDAQMENHLYHYAKTSHFRYGYDDIFHQRNGHTKEGSIYKESRNKEDDVPYGSNSRFDEEVLVSAWNLLTCNSRREKLNGRYESSATIYIYAPRTLRSLKIENIFDGFAHLNSISFIFKNTENLTAVYYTYNHIVLSNPGRVVGLSSVTFLDISGSAFHVGYQVFNDLVSLQTLIMQAMLPDDFFVRAPLLNILRNKHNLLHLDISNNGFNQLRPYLFSNNPALQTLVLAKNRFTNIPFNMRLTPQLEFLDLTHNAIYILHEDERYVLDSQVEKVGHFTLTIQDNAIDCACSGLGFIAWLQTTPITLDSEGNYSCISQTGVSSYTGKISDIPAVWRQCNGRMMLLVSFVLASLMAVVFLLAFLMMRFRTALEAFVLRAFAGAFRPMTPADYKTTVFIGYADEDVRFVRYILRRYLEDDLGVTTFIHHRDLEPGYTDQQFFTAIRGSWRVLVVISEEFLQRYDLAHVVMKYASHSVTPVNQGRVFVLVEETQLYNLPDYLHGVLEDSRIIIMQDLHHQLNYEQKQKIQQCLRPA